MDLPAARHLLRPGAGRVVRQPGVNIVSANKLTNTSNTYQVRWKEKQFSETGMEMQDTSYLGVFTVEYVNEKNEELVAKNPLGIIIKDFTISRENN